MNRFIQFILGKPQNPLSEKAYKSLALPIFFAWVGLGADGLSSACYGPEQAFLALGRHQSLALWLVIATALTVFIIAFAYNHVISLFPDGGGGYKVATYLLGPYAGLAAGVALILDYILTISISVASATNAILSNFNVHSVDAKQLIDTVAIVLLIFINMRGMKESIKVLMFVFIGFIVIHAGVIIYGVSLHASNLPIIYHQATQSYGSLFKSGGFLFVSALMLHAYAQGGGTYTGLEAVSNNVNTLAEPRIRTGRWTMFYMALSLSLVAGGILLLYLLWRVHAVPGQTLNAVMLREIFPATTTGHIIITSTLLFEAGLLFVAANTGFLGGPAVLSNMAIDQWVPKAFLNISSRLVKQNGILVLGIAALALIFITNSHVSMLIIIYSMCVFLAFTLALAGLVRYYLFEIEQKTTKTILSAGLIILATLVCATIFLFIITNSFFHGAWVAILMIIALLYFCLYVRKSYRKSNKMTALLDKELCIPLTDAPTEAPSQDTNKPTAVIFVGDSIGVGMHTFLNIKRMFKTHYKNFVFVKVGVIDSKSAIGTKKIKRMRKDSLKELEYFTRFCTQKSIPSEHYFELSVDTLKAIKEIVSNINEKYGDTTYFASQLIFPTNKWLQKILYNKTALTIQRELYAMGFNMMILPVRVHG
jgi:amino acid transporter